MIARLVAAAVLALSTVACSPDGDIAFDSLNVDFTGDYSVTVTNGYNGCAFADWVEGESSANIPLKITQTGATLTALVDGIPGALLGLLHGSNEFTGEVSRAELQMWIDGTIPTTQGNCTFTWSNDASAALDGDYLDGKLVYSPAHNENPDCAPITCRTEQLFNGTRPKRAP